jgi:hypothetical protein
MSTPSIEKYGVGIDNDIFPQREREHKPDRGLVIHWRQQENTKKSNLGERDTRPINFQPQKSLSIGVMKQPVPSPTYRKDGYLLPPMT